MAQRPRSSSTAQSSSPRQSQVLLRRYGREWFRGSGRVDYKGGWEGKILWWRGCCLYRALFVPLPIQSSSINRILHYMLYVGCQSDNYWLNARTPCLTYGLRGISYYKVTVSGPARDLHSGVFGRTVHEPMTDLIQLMSKLVTPAGEILIPGVDDLVAPLTEEEKSVFVSFIPICPSWLLLCTEPFWLLPPFNRARYDILDYSVADIEQSAGAAIALTDDKASVLMGRMRYPSLSLHGIEGAFSAPGAKTVIPAKVSGKFSIRCVFLLNSLLCRIWILLYIWANREFARQTCPRPNARTHWSTRN